MSGITIYQKPDDVIAQRGAITYRDNAKPPIGEKGIIETLGKGLLIRAEIPPKPHMCPTPNWLKRLFARIKNDDLWMCSECNKVYSYHKVNDRWYEAGRSCWESASKDKDYIV
jgi:hypothetical protein